MMTFARRGFGCVAMLGAVLRLAGCGGGAGDNGGGGGAPAGDGGAPTGDAGAPTGDAAVDGQNPPPRTCGESPWPTYGHDPQRTSSSDGCITGPLTFAWAAAKPPKNVDHAVVTNDAVYGSTQNAILDRLALDGGSAWEWSPNRDFEVRQWTTSAFGKILVEDDGLFLVDAVDPVHNTITVNAYDDWGQNTADADRFYVNSEINSPDGPGLYTGAYDKTGKSVWKQDVFKQCGNGGSELHGALAVDGGKVFRSGVFIAITGAPPFASGVKSFDAATGAPGWDQPTTPASAMSAGGGDVYLIEGASGDSLVARQQSDGAVAWTAALGVAASVQAPLLASGLVVIATATDVRAFQMATGAPAWTAPKIKAATSANKGSGKFDRCQAAAAQWATFPDTSLAAAKGSDTLVVTALDGVHILSLSTGADLQHGPVAKITGPLKSPVVVGHTVYAIDTGASQLVALTSP